MAKETFYFSHDYHSRKDPKCVALIQDFGASGYGIYWCLVEIMYEQGGKIKKFPALYSALSKEFGIPIDEFMKQIEAMLHDFCLLQQDETHLWSDAVLNRLELREEKRIVKSNSGRLGGIKSGESRRYKKESQETTKQIEAPLEANEANEPKESKEKESKEKNTTTLNGLSDKIRGSVVFDAEETIIGNQIEFERICCAAGKDLDHCKASLRKYHLYLEENEKYPKGRKAVFAGFEKWLLNEKNFTNGPHQQLNGANGQLKPGTSEARIQAAKKW